MDRARAKELRCFCLPVVFCSKLETVLCQTSEREPQPARGPPFHRRTWQSFRIGGRCMSRTVLVQMTIDIEPVTVYDYVTNASLSECVLTLASAWMVVPGLRGDQPRGGAAAVRGRTATSNLTGIEWGTTRTETCYSIARSSLFYLDCQ